MVNITIEKKCLNKQENTPFLFIHKGSQDDGADDEREKRKRRKRSKESPKF